ncbi:MAG: SURF1 family protein [Pseudomonas sp.]
MFFLPLLLCLGVWQLDRAEQKRQLQAQIHERRQQPAIALTDLAPSTSPAWRSLHLTGRFDPQRVWLLDNRTRHGQAGVEVLQLFHDQPSGQQLIINRGWLAWPDRRQLPSVPTPEGRLQLHVEALPDPGQGFRLRSTSGTGWPKLIAHIELPTLSEQAGVTLTPWTARLQPGSPGALRLEWPALTMPASKHLGYAVQWFALAVALLILFIWAGFRSEPWGNNNNDEHD